MSYESAITALDDPALRLLLERLTDGPRSVGELAQGLPISRPAVSQHLRVLREANLVHERREGTKRVYHLDPERPPPAPGLLRRFLGARPGRIQGLGRP